MNGINYVLDTYSIGKTDIASAVQKVKNLNLSLNTVRHFLSEAVELDEDETLPAVTLEQGSMILGHMVQTGLRKNVIKFSLQAFNEFAARTKDIRPIVIETVPKLIVEPVVSFEPPPVIVTPITVNKPVTIDMKGKRNRKVDPTSNLSRAKAYYAAASDKSRGSIVTLFQKELGIETGTATTYYYLAKKG